MKPAYLRFREKEHHCIFPFFFLWKSNELLIFLLLCVSTTPFEIGSVARLLALFYFLVSPFSFRYLCSCLYSSPSPLTLPWTFVELPCMSCIHLCRLRPPPRSSSSPSIYSSLIHILARTAQLLFSPTELSFLIFTVISLCPSLLPLCISPLQIISALF